MAENGDTEGGAGGAKAALFAVAALILLAGGWAMQREAAAPMKGEGARVLPSPATDSPPLPAHELRLIRGEEALVELGAGGVGELLTLRLALSEEAAGIGIHSIWLYGENHAPLQITGERADPGEVRVEIASELLAPGRHIVELRTDELTAIPLRRYSFEVR